MTYTNKENIYQAAAEPFGGFVNTDGDWCMTKNANEFKRFLENNFGFVVVECKATNNSTAVAITEDGLRIAWNGHCKKIAE